MSNPLDGANSNAGDFSQTSPSPALDSTAPPSFAFPPPAKITRLALVANEAMCLFEEEASIVLRAAFPPAQLARLVRAVAPAMKIAETGPLDAYTLCSVISKFWHSEQSILPHLKPSGLDKSDSEARRLEDCIGGIVYYRNLVAHPTPGRAPSNRERKRFVRHVGAALGAYYLCF